MTIAYGVISNYERISFCRQLIQLEWTQEKLVRSINKQLFQVFFFSIKEKKDVVG